MSQGKLGGSGGGQGGGGDLMTVLFGSNYQSLFGGQQNTGGMPGSNPSMPSGGRDFTMPQMNTPNFGSIGGDLDTMFGQTQQNIAQPTFNAPSSGPQAIMYEGPKRTYTDEPLIPSPQYQTPQQPVQQPMYRPPQQRAPMQPRAPQRPQQRPAAPGNPLVNKAIGAGTGAVNKAIGGGISKGVGYGTDAISKGVGGLFGDSTPEYTYDDSAGGLYGPTPEGGNINDQYGYDDSYGYSQPGTEYTGGQDYGGFYDTEPQSFIDDSTQYTGGGDYGGFYDTEPVSDWSNWGGVQEFDTPDFSLDTSQMDWGNDFGFESPSFDFGNDFDFGGFDMDFGGGWDW